MAASRLIIHNSARIPASGLGGAFNGVVDALTVPGGRTVIAHLFVRHEFNELAELSAATGKVIRVLFAGRSPLQADPITVDAGHVLLRLPLKNQPQVNVVCWRLAAANLRSGRISYLPLPTFCTSQSPPPLLGSW
jgi:hypothetical protein